MPELQEDRVSTEVPPLPFPKTMGEICGFPNKLNNAPYLQKKLGLSEDDRMSFNHALKELQGEIDKTDQWDEPLTEKSRDAISHIFRIFCIHIQEPEKTSRLWTLTSSVVGKLRAAMY